MPCACSAISGIKHSLHASLMGRVARNTVTPAPQSPAGPSSSAPVLFLTRAGNCPNWRGKMSSIGAKKSADRSNGRPLSAIANHASSRRPFALPWWRRILLASFKLATARSLCGDTESTESCFGRNRESMPTPPISSLHRNSKLILILSVRTQCVRMSH